MRRRARVVASAEMLERFVSAEWAHVGGEQHERFRAWREARRAAGIRRRLRVEGADRATS